MTYTLDFSDCLRDLQVGDGSPPGPLSWNPGEELELGLRGLTSFTPPTDNTEQRIVFKRAVAGRVDVVRRAHVTHAH